MKSHSMTRRAALELYRRIVRAARRFDAVEGADAIAEARTAFRANANAVNAEELLVKCEQRLEVATHYGISHERMAHAALAGGGNKDVQPPSGVSEDAGRSAALRQTMASQFPVNPAAAKARAAARARRAAVSRSESEGSGGA